MRFARGIRSLGGASPFRGLAMVLALSLSIALPSLSVAAEDEDEDGLAKPWQEEELKLPGFPEKSDLIPFTVGGRSDMEYYVDGKSLNVGKDDVIRFTMLIVSPSGAESVTYEGLRCATKERRIYATGRKDRSWSRSPNSRWVEIRGGTNNPRAELWASYFCIAGTGTSLNTADALRSLRSSGRPIP